MKNKPIKARKMWVNYYSQNFLPALHQSKKSAIQCCGPSVEHRAIPVAVIPVDDVRSLIDRATSAHYNAVQAHPYHVPTPGAMIAALTAIGVLPRKGGCK